MIAFEKPFSSGHSTTCFVYSFLFQVIREKTLCRTGFTRNMRNSYMKIIVTTIPTNLVTNLLTNQIFSKFVIC